MPIKQQEKKGDVDLLSVIDPDSQDCDTMRKGKRLFRHQVFTVVSSDILVYCEQSVGVVMTYQGLGIKGSDPSGMKIWVSSQVALNSWSDVQG